MTSTLHPQAVPRVQNAWITALGLFDVAYAIDIGKARELCADMPSLSEPPGPLRFGVPPLRLRHTSVAIEVGGVQMTGNVAVHLYEFGTITLDISFDIEDMAWPVFVDTAREIEQALAFDKPGAPWMPLLEQIKTRIAAALERANDAVIQEDYQLIEIEDFSEPLGMPLHLAVDLTPLLAGDARPLSDNTRETLLRHRFGYLADDCVVITRDRAVLYQPGGDAGIDAVLEAANAQLLELRHYGALLDDELPRMYDLVDRTRTVSAFLAPAELSRLARRLYTVVAEVTELTEKVDNALEATGHPYLAQVYTTTLELFGVPAVGAAVDRKLAIVRDTYAALYDEAAVSRAGLLEITIVVLIAVELILAVIK
ncbi:MAG: hypothetical protein WBW32_00375 [Luteibacter sp.]